MTAVRNLYFSRLFHNSLSTRLSQKTKYSIYGAMYRQYRDDNPSDSQKQLDQSQYTSPHEQGVGTMMETSKSESSTTPKVSVSDDHTAEVPADENVGDQSHKKSRKVFKSSVAIIPPEHIWDQIQRIREVHDKVFKRWMPHINMLYPFFKDEDNTFEEVTKNLTEAFKDVEPFKVSFSKDSFGYFKHKKYCTVWLKPLDPSVPITQPQASSNTNVMEDSTDASDSKAPALLEQELGSPEPKAEKTKEQPNEEINNDSIDKQGGATGGSEEFDICGISVFDEEKREEQTKPKSKRQKKKGGKFKPVNTVDPMRLHIPFHAKVVELQKLLEEQYPMCDDLSTRSELGFNPHLSLGQFSAKDAENAISEFQNEWSEINFEVNEVYLISREDFDDPFHMRFAVPLGSGH